MNCFSQVASTPVIAFIDFASKTAEINLKNNGKVEKEVEIYFRFSYADYDSLGNFKMVYGDSSKFSRFSLENYLVSFPKKVRLMPGEEQTARILLRSFPANMPDGIYWSRYFVKYRDIARQIDSACPQKNGFEGNVNLVMEISYPIVYFKGKFVSKADIKDIHFHSDTSGFFITADYLNKGNSPFFGLSNCIIYDHKGQPIDTIPDRFTLYQDCTRRIFLDRNKIKPGRYKACIEISTDRPDIPREYRQDFIPLTRTFDFDVQ
jgi:hypothetical protein